jgi:membrane protein DedA with SNARE-associated domain
MLYGSIASYFVDKIQTLSPGLVYVVVALLVFSEAALFVGFVLPGETSVLVAGLIASQGRINVVVVCVIVVAAAILGDTVGYFVGERESSLQLATTSKTTCRPGPGSRRTS